MATAFFSTKLLVFDLIKDNLGYILVQVRAFVVLRVHPKTMVLLHNYGMVHVHLQISVYVSMLLFRNEVKGGGRGGEGGGGGGGGRGRGRGRGEGERGERGKNDWPEHIGEGGGGQRSDECACKLTQPM